MFAVSIDQRTPQLIIIITTTITTIPKLTFLGEDFVDYDGADPMAVREDSDLATDDAKAAAAGVAGAGGREVTDSTALCVALLADTGVALVPGDAFGAPKVRQFVRSFAHTHSPALLIHLFDGFDSIRLLAWSTNP